MNPLGRRERLLLAGVLLVGLGLRLFAVFEQRGDVLFEHPALDEQRYVEVARALAAGEPGEARPWWQPPGIVYALAVVFRVAGPGLVAPRVLQALLATASCLLLFLLGRRLFGPRIALAAAAIMALHGVLVFESCELLPPTWIVFWDLAALVLLLRARAGESVPAALGAGLALGVSAVFSPTVLPFVLPAALWLRRGPLVAALCVGILVPIAPVTARNWNHGHELVLVSTNGGLNFYLGNNPDSAATLELRPGPRWDALALEPRRHGVRGAGAASAYFGRKGLAFYRDQPGRALAHLGRKLYLFCNGAEIPRDTDIIAAREGSRVLAALVRPRPAPLPDGLLIPLGLLGAALCFGDRRRLAVPYLFLATQLLVIAAFFVTSRHRVPALPLFALFAAAGGAALWRRLRAGRLRARLGPLAALAALLVLCNLPTREAAVSYAAERDLYRGLAYRDRGEPGAAADAFRRAATRDPTDARAWLELGDALTSAGRPGEALEPWRRAAALDPTDSRAARRLSAALAAGPASSPASQPR